MLLQQLRHDRADGLAPGRADRAGGLPRTGRALAAARSVGHGFFPAARRAAVALATRAIGHTGAAGIRRFRAAAAAGGPSPRPAGRVEPVVEQALRLAPRTGRGAGGTRTPRSSPPRQWACWPTSIRPRASRRWSKWPAASRSRWDCGSQPRQAFRRNSEKHGLLLTTGEIRTQYDRFNASENLDAPTQHVLGLILDCIEAPTAKGFRVQDSGFSAPSQALRGGPDPEPQYLNPGP